MILHNPKGLELNFFIFSLKWGDITQTKRVWTKRDLFGFFCKSSLNSPCCWSLSSSHFVTSNSNSIKPSKKVRFITYYMLGESFWCWQQISQQKIYCQDIFRKEIFAEISIFSNYRSRVLHHLLAETGLRNLGILPPPPSFMDGFCKNVFETPSYDVM